MSNDTVAYATAGQAGINAAPAGSVLTWHDGSIAYRTKKPREDVEAWLIVRPDGTTVGAGYITINELAPLYQRYPMAAQPHI